MFQNKYTENSIYEWNTNRMSKYNILNFLQQMTVVRNVYKTKLNSSDHAIV